jgi:chromosome partitioning protein
MIGGKMKIISVGSCKGGSAKTMTVISTASILAERGYRVLIIDIDPQANATNNLGVEIDVKINEDGETKKEIKTIKEVYENPKCDVRSVIYKTPIKSIPNLDIIPSTVMLTATQLKINSQSGREFILRNFFRRNENVFNEYDFIFFDTNPYMLTINQNAYVISDSIFLTTACGMNNLKGVELFQALWQDISEKLDVEDKIKGILVTKYDQRIKLHKEFIEYVKNKEEFKGLLFDTIIPNNARLEETEVEFKPINIYDKSSKGYVSYNNFVEEFLKRV